jgi:hypothetical protein
LALRADTWASVSSVDNMACFRERENARRGLRDCARAGRKDVYRKAGLSVAVTGRFNCRTAAILEAIYRRLQPIFIWPDRKRSKHE